MFCPKCGAQNPEGSVFCGGCGASLDGAAQPQTVPVAIPQTQIQQRNPGSQQGGYGQPGFQQPKPAGAPFSFKRSRKPPRDGRYRADPEFWRWHRWRTVCTHIAVILYLLSSTLVLTVGSSYAAWYWITTIVFWAAFIGLFVIDFLKCWPMQNTLSPEYNPMEFRTISLWYAGLIGGAIVFMLIMRIMSDVSAAQASSSFYGLLSAFEDSTDATGPIILNALCWGLLASGLALRNERKISSYANRSIIEYVIAGAALLVFLFMLLAWVSVPALASISTQYQTSYSLPQLGALMSAFAMVASLASPSITAWVIVCFLMWMAALVMLVVTVVFMTHGKGRKRFTNGYVAFGLSAVSALIWLIVIGSVNGQAKQYASSASGGLLSNDIVVSTAFPWLVLFISIAALVGIFLSMVMSRNNTGPAIGGFGIHVGMPQNTRMPSQQGMPQTQMPLQQGMPQTQMPSQQGMPQTQMPGQNPGGGYNRR